jgi:NADPH:quinone reductase
LLLTFQLTFVVDAATLPLAYLTSAVGVYIDLQVPEPWSPLRPKDGEKVPILVWGVSSATGAFGAQLARLSGLLVIGVAGKAAKLAQSVSDYVVDYRQGEDALVKEVEEILKKEGLPPKFKVVYDAISEGGSHEAIARLIDPNGGKVSNLLPPAKFAKSGPDFKYPDGVTDIVTSVGTSFNKNKDFAHALLRYLAEKLKDGGFKPQPYEVIPGGLEGVETGLKNLEAGKASGVKYVYRVSETPGAGKDAPKA